MIGTQFTITNADGDSVTINDHATDPSRVIALQSYPQMDVDIKSNDIDLEGQHGVWEFFSYYGSRISTFTGVIVADNEAEVDTIKTDLLRVLRLPTQPTDASFGQVNVEYVDPNGIAWQYEAKLFRPISFNRQLKTDFRLDFSFTLKSADPFIVGQDEVSTDGVAGWYNNGLTVPLEMPFSWTNPAQNVVQITNEGVAFAQTIITLRGQDVGVMTNPTITNTTTGKKMTINTVLEDENDSIIIDSKAGTIVDQDGTDLTGLVSNDSEFVLLQQGDNDLIFTSDEAPETVLYYPTATYTVVHRNTTI